MPADDPPRLLPTPQVDLQLPLRADPHAEHREDEQECRSLVDWYRGNLELI